MTSCVADRLDYRWSHSIKLTALDSLLFLLMITTVILFSFICFIYLLHSSLVQCKQIWIWGVIQVFSGVRLEGSNPKSWDFEFERWTKRSTEFTILIHKRLYRSRCRWAIYPPSLPPSQTQKLCLPLAPCMLERFIGFLGRCSKSLEFATSLCFCSATLAFNW